MIKVISKIYDSLPLEYVYILYCSKVMWRCKVGITNDPRRRASEVEAAFCTAFGPRTKIKRLITLPLFFPRPIEKAIHNVFARFNAQRSVPYHSGRTEWFWSFNVVVSILVYAYAYYFGWSRPEIWAIVALFIPFGLDLMLSAVLLFLCQWGIVCMALYYTTKFIGLVAQVLFSTLL